ncbi:MAG TPA: glycosyltransferase family 4 protein [Acidimicrobiales bacterium]|nr:glycosyltransferase family 4 protein [Acidimicrobiales bacterium]
MIRRYRASPLVPGAARPLILGAEWVTTKAGGLNRYLAALTDVLSRLGPAPHVVVVGPAPTAPMAHGASRSNAPLPVRLLSVRRAASRLADHVDVVDAHFALYALLPATTTALRRVPLVVHFHGPWAEESQLGRGEGSLVVTAKRAVERSVYQRARVVVVLSAAFGHLVVERYGVDPARVEVVAPGVDLEWLRPGDRAAARAHFDLPANGFVAVSVRRLDARMGLDILLEAWATVQTDQPDAVLLLAGEGRERGDLERRRANLLHPDHVRFLGPVNDDRLLALYQAADCSIVPTRALEGFGLVTLESAACGTPAIVTDVGGLPDGVRDLDPTLVVPADDADALAARILAAAAGDLPNRAATRAHAERFSWEGVARRHIEIYERARARRPLRVAYIGHTAQLSGGELALARLLPALTSVEAHVVLAEDGPLVTRLRESGIAVEVLPMGEAARSLRRDRVRPGGVPLATVAGSVLATWRLARRLRALRPDLVHTNTLKAALYGGVAGRLAGVPVVWHIRDRIAADYLPAPAVRLVRLASRLLPAAVIANSQATLATVGGRPARTRIYDAVVPSPVTAAQPASARRSAERSFTVGLVGRLAPWKGQDVFLRAFAQAFPEGDARARVVGTAMFGEDDWARGLRDLASGLGICERVDFTGFVDDMTRQYALLDVAVHASVIPEPFGQVVVEAMSNGLPVVAADAGGPGEILSDGIDGLLYPMGDANALAQRLRRLASDPGLRARLGEAGRRRADAFSPDKVAAQVMDVYSGVIAQSSNRRAPLRLRRNRDLGKSQ